MSNRFAEREHRRSKGLPPLDSVEDQIAVLDDDLRELQCVARSLSRGLRDARAALGELRQDLAKRKK